MKVTKYRNDLPDWAYAAMMLECPYCNSLLCDNENLTARWCPNPKCPGHMAFKVVDICNYFGIKGIGEKTARELIYTHHWEEPCACIPYFFNDNKPRASIAEIAVFFNIDGYGKTMATKELSAYATFEDYFEKAPYINPILLNWREQLQDAEKYFELKRPMATKKINVMATGAFHGFSNRNDFFAKINDAFGEYVHVVDVGKRKTGVQFLIKEVDAPDRSKATLAKQQRVPIVTPAQFFAIMKQLCSYSDEDNKGEEV